MNPIRLAIERPTAVMAVVIMAVLFGMLALSRIPVQLAPDVRKPIVVVQTNWPVAAPAEIEREIVNAQEDAFRGLEGLERMTSRSRSGQASVTLEFGIGSDMGDVLLLVSNRLDRVGGYPAEAGEPSLNTSGSDDSPVAWVMVSELMEARDERRLLRLQKQLANVKLLIIDELGFVPLSKTGAELLFELISQRYERGATLITSNLPFDEWTETFGTERLTGALLDRLTHHVNILEMNGESYRLAQSRARKSTDTA
jgi:Cu/Ag efflux pump CusA